MDGKTIIAAATAQDEEIRASFDKIAWVSVGQKPNLRELQDLIHVQLAGARLPGSATSPELAIMAIRSAAKGSKVLLVLDDVWDAKHAKSLNCVDRVD